MAMLENISEFFKRFMQSDKKELLAENPTSQSKDTAKDRLHVVLMQDRANVSADFLELMKEEIIEVIRKYIVVDESKIDVRLTNEENEDGSLGVPLLHANIPILNIRNDLKSTYMNGNSSDKIDGQEEIDFEANSKTQIIETIKQSDLEKKNEEIINIEKENKDIVEKTNIEEQNSSSIEISENKNGELDDIIEDVTKENEINFNNNLDLNLHTIENQEDIKLDNEESKNINENILETKEKIVIEEQQDSNENILGNEQNIEENKLEIDKENKESEENLLENIESKIEEIDYNIEDYEEDDDDVTFDDLLKAAEEEERLKKLEGKNEDNKEENEKVKKTNKKKTTQRKKKTSKK